jgi:hypothetical protein
LQALAAEALKFGVNGPGTIVAEITPAHTQRDHAGEFHQHPVADPERRIALVEKPLLRRRKAGVGASSPIPPQLTDEGNRVPRKGGLVGMKPPQPLRP